MSEAGRMVIEKTVEDALEEIKTFIKEGQSLLGDNIEVFRLEAKTAIEEVANDVKGLAGKVDQESKVNIIQDKDILELKDDIGGMGKRLNELFNSFEKTREKLTEARVKEQNKNVKIGIIWKGIAIVSALVIQYIILKVLP